VMTEDNFKISQKYSLIGVSESRKVSLMSMKKGDGLVFYISRKKIGQRGTSGRVCEFGGIGKVIGEACESQNPIWNTVGDITFPYRRKVEITPAKQRVQVTEMLNSLDFLVGKKKWGGFFLQSLRKISDKDFETIKNAIL
ncbi:TPA: EVE domain-containing protein, partial [Candidatus Poribacteria bacterium]|nr:EVE domain-containing protein [Candidatus Poribacteria bacterium]